MAGRHRVVQRLQLFGTTFARRNEHDDGDQHRTAYGCASRNRNPVHVARHRDRCPYFPALAVRHSVRCDSYFLQRYDAHDDAFLR